MLGLHPTSLPHSNPDYLIPTHFIPHLLTIYCTPDQPTTPLVFIPTPQHSLTSHNPHTMLLSFSLVLIQCKVTIALVHIDRWLLAVRFIVSAEKTKAVIFHQHKHQLRYQSIELFLAPNPLTVRHTVKFLRHMFDD